jgi:hypothetical protein
VCAFVRVSLSVCAGLLNLQSCLDIPAIIKVELLPPKASADIKDMAYPPLYFSSTVIAGLRGPPATPWRGSQALMQVPMPPVQIRPAEDFEMLHPARP